MNCGIASGNPKIPHLGRDIFVDTPGKMVEPDEGYIDHPTPKPKHFIRGILKMFTREDFRSFYRKWKHSCCVYPIKQKIYRF